MKINPRFFSIFVIISLFSSRFTLPEIKSGIFSPVKSQINYSKSLQAITTPIDITSRVKVVSSSLTQTGYSLSNALDGDPNDDIAIAGTSDSPFTFILFLGYFTNISTVEITWSDETSYATQYSIQSSDAAGVVLGNFAVITNGSGYFQKSNPGAPIPGSFLKFTISAYQNSPEVKIRQIKILADPPNQIQSLLMSPDYENSGVFMNAGDPTNPLRYFIYAPIMNNLKTAADLILGNESGLTDHEKIFRFMQFINTFYSGTGFVSSEQTELQEMILSGYGNCGPFSTILIALAATQGIYGRHIALHNYPVNDGHTVVELLIGGRWQLYDPSYAAYYTYTPNDQKTPQLLNFADLRSGQGSDPSVSRLVFNQQRYSIDPIHAEGFLGPAIYTQANPAGPVEPDNRMVFPLSLDFNDHRIDLSSGYSAHYQGAFIFGVLNENISQEFTITGLQPGQNYSFKATYSYYGTTNPLATEFNASASMFSSGQMVSGNTYKYVPYPPSAPWEIDFIAASNQEKILLTHNYNANFDYLIVDSYEVIPGLFNDLFLPAIHFSS